MRLSGRHLHLPRDGAAIQNSRHGSLGSRTPGEGDSRSQLGWAAHCKFRAPSNGIAGSFEQNGVAKQGSILFMRMLLAMFRSVVMMRLQTVASHSITKLAGKPGSLSHPAFEEFRVHSSDLQRKAALGAPRHREPFGETPPSKPKLRGIWARESFEPESPNMAFGIRYVCPWSSAF